ncbi:MAG TPA: hypothetical protein VD884_09210, partial [Ohtaekwangia sp.]|nr:hypothetical protein [Ohtaekwangia sp.]
AEASYEIASFNTHRISVNGLYRDSARNYFLGGEAFFNYSDNDYRVSVEIENEQTSNMEKQEVRLFHAAFKQYYGEVYGGVVNKKWADELRFGLTGFWIDRDNQYGANMVQALGASTSRQYSIIPTIRYKKNLFNDKLLIDQFFVANTIHTEQVDTARGTYTWHGEFRPAEPGDPRRGETSIRGSLSDVAFSVFTSRTNLAYQLAPNHKLELNAVFTKLKRVGSDPLGLRFKGSEIDILSVPAYYNKSITSFGIESHFFNDKLVNNLIVKYYSYQTEALEGDWEGNRVDRTASNSQWGIAEALKIELTDHSFVRVSAEAATRLPEQEEIFGNGNLHLSNFALKPERSANLNVGFLTTKNNRFSLEVNSFYRLTHDLILNVPVNLIFNQNQNVENVKGIGLEADVAVTILPWLKSNGNFTYQDFRLFDTGNETREGSRLRHTPYFFANLGLNATSRKLFGTQDRFEAYWYFTFVKEYYLDYLPKEFEPDGFLGLWGSAGVDAPNIIPDQTLHAVGLTYFPFNEKISFGMQCKNVFDTKVFDNFKIQNAGRSFHFKVTYTLN